MNYLIKNGKIILNEEIKKKDILIKDGLIAIIDDKIEGINAENIIDAKEKYVLPGLIDIHTHLDDQIGNFYLADTYLSGSKIAITNGITTIYSFITQGKNESLTEAVSKALKKAKGNSYCDYGWHITPTNFDVQTWNEIYEFYEKGFRSYKFYTTYKKAGIYSSYEKINEILEKFKRKDAIFLFHCEDEEILERSLERNIDFSKSYSHAESRPVEAEIKAIEKLLHIFKKYDNRYHIVHVSTSDGAKLIFKEKENIKITMETCPHYLIFDDSALKSLNDGFKYICSPPLRNKNEKEKLLELAKDSFFDIYATDHCAFLKKDKKIYNNDIRNTPNGLPGLGAIMHIIYSLFKDNPDKAVKELCKRLSENPAKILNLYPKKGAIKVGADADLFILDINGNERNISSSYQDVYEPYESYKTKLNIDYLFLRGNLVVEKNIIKDENIREGVCLCQ